MAIKRRTLLKSAFGILSLGLLGGGSANGRSWRRPFGKILRRKGTAFEIENYTCTVPAAGSTFTIDANGYMYQET